MHSEFQHTDEDIIQMVQKGGRSFEQAAEYLFDQYKGYFVNLHQKYKLQENESQDVYADAIVKVLGQIRLGKFKGESKLSSYFYSILNNRFVDVLRTKTSNKNAPTKELMEYDAREKDLLGVLENKDQTNLIIAEIGNLGAPCKGILLDWGYYGYPMNEIAERNNLSNAESARSMKYKCLKKLKVQLSNKNINHG